MKQSKAWKEASALATLAAISMAAPAYGEATRLMETVRAKQESLPPARAFHAFNVENQKRDEKPVDPKALPPHRVLATYLPERSEWRFVVTNEKGLVAEPLEILRVGTILPGRFFGPSFAQNRYLLNDEGSWVRTFRDEQWFLWAFSKPPKVKVLGFRDLKKPVSRREFLATLKTIQQRRRKKPSVRPQAAAGDRQPRLYDPFKSRSVASTTKAPLLPSRVYEVYVPELDSWHFALTDGHGNLPQPLEILRRGAVLSGSWFGMPDFEMRQLSLDENWVPVRKWARHECIVLSDPPRIKVVSFIKADEK